MEDATTYNLVLVGFMGTGKTRAGRSLARKLGRGRAFDTDAWITEQAGATVPEIFARYGETAFRDLETAAAREVSRRSGLIVSTGGGILGRDENVELLRRHGALICLEARPEVILARTAPWENRPMLRMAENPGLAVERLLSERAPRYALADWSLDTSDLSVEEVVDRICARLPSLYEIAATRS